MVNSISSYSATCVQSTNTSGLSEEEKKKKKAQEDGLFADNNQQNTASQNNPSSQITEETARSTAQSYIASLKAQYPQLASKLDSYYSNLNFSSLASDAASVSDIKAYIYCETQGFLNR